MRVLIVSQYFWPESFRVNDLALGLSDRGHQVTVVTGQPNYEFGSFPDGYSAFSPRRQMVGDVRVERFPLVSRGKGTGARLALNYLSFAITSSLWAPLRLREPFDVVLVYQMSPVTMALPAFVLAKLRNMPVVFWVQDLWPDTLRAMGKLRNDDLFGLADGLVAKMYRAADLVLVAMKRFTPRVLASGLPPERVCYLPNWAETIYQPRHVEKDAVERTEMPDGFRLMFAGNLGHAQATETILEAAVQLRDVDDIQWVMVGDGRRREWAERRVVELGLESRFTFLGRRPVETMPRLLALADALLVTLRADPIYADTVPSRLQSYLACGKPIIASIDGEGADVVEEAQAGITCPAGNGKKLAEAVLTMRNLPVGRREVMGLNGRRYSEAHFQRDVLLSRLEGWMVDVVAARRRQIALSER